MSPCHFIYSISLKTKNTSLYTTSIYVEYKPYSQYNETSEQCLGIFKVNYLFLNAIYIQISDLMKLIILEISLFMKFFMQAFKVFKS